MAGNLIISIFRLVRPKNIFIILATMLGVYYTLAFNNPLVHVSRFDFILLLLSTALIAGAGNMINDYFDVKADRVNKPHRLIISKHVKRRWAIILHWVFNFSALIISIYLSSKYSTFWYVFINLLAINTLWFYSVYFKKKIFFGNLIIAIMTGFIPLLALSFFVFSKDSGVFNQVKGHWYENPQFHIVYLLSFFAMMQNLAREICKDIADIPGDRKIHVKSIPMKYGLKTTKLIIAIILSLQIIILNVVYPIYELKIGEWTYSILMLALSLNLFIMILMLKNELFVKYSQSLLKLSMLIGLSALFI
jgi:4-hydroxybenzoate polyprenyltransferase